MALSGSVDFNQTRNDIINRSLRIIGALESGENASADEMADGSVSLNAMVKAWQGTGYRLWTKKEGVLYLTKGQTKYTLGPNSTDHATEESDAKKTALAVAAVATDTTITVDSDDDIANADNIGIVLDDGTFHWTTVNGAPAADVVTLTVAMPSAAAIGKKVHSYTSKLVRPLKVMDEGARRRDEIADQDIPIITVPREEYFGTPNKTTQSLTTQIYFDPQLADGNLYTWPAAPDIDSTVRFTFAKPIQDFDQGLDDPDFPQEWIECLHFNLAVRLAPEYGAVVTDDVRGIAASSFAAVTAWDREPESVFVTPDMTISGWG